MSSRESSETAAAASSADQEDEDDLAFEQCDHLSEEFDHDCDPTRFRIPDLTTKEKNLLQMGIRRYGPGNIAEIGKFLPGRNALQIANYISALEWRLSRQSPSPNRFGYCSDEDDEESVPSNGSETLSADSDSSDCSSPKSEPDLRNLDTSDYLNLFDIGAIRRRYSLPEEFDENSWNELFDGLVLYLRKIMRNVIALSGLNLQYFQTSSKGGWSKLTIIDRYIREGISLVKREYKLEEDIEQEENVDRSASEEENEKKDALN